MMWIGLEQCSVGALTNLFQELSYYFDVLRLGINTCSTVKEHKIDINMKKALGGLLCK